MTETTQEAKPAPSPRPRTNPVEQMVVMASFLAGFVILIDPAARHVTGSAVGFVLEPLIGFGHQVPVLTILLASVVMVLVTSGVRHYFTDYLKQAKSQEVMKAFQREMREARKSNNLHMMKKLTEKNKDLMAIQAEQSTSQMKPMAITMVVVIPIFAWLLVFLDPGSAAGAANAGCESIARVPWDASWCMDINIVAPPLTFIPRWVALYSLFSIPLGQVVQRALKVRDLQAELTQELPPASAERSLP
jgi:uncharacterized membrane protein (DUF106 family)